MKKTLIFLAMVLSMTTMAAKVGYINTGEIFQKYSKTVALRKNLNKEKTRLESEIKGKEVKLQKIQLDLQSKGNKVTEQEKKKFQKEVEGLQKFAMDSQTKLRKEEMERVAEIDKILKKSINKIAKSEKADYIFEGEVMRFGGINFTSKVLADMEKNK